MTRTVPKEKYDELLMKLKNLERNLNAWEIAYEKIYDQLGKLRNNIKINMRILR